MESIYSEGQIMSAYSGKSEPNNRAGQGGMKKFIRLIISIFSAIIMLPGAARAAVEYLVVDTSLPGSAGLIRSLQADTRNKDELRIIPVGADENGIEKITRVLASAPTKVDAIHIFSHAVPGALLLDGEKIDRAALDRPEVRFPLTEVWRNALTEQADILLYGCELAAGETGMAFIRRFGEITGADVTASLDLTGYAELGGDWELEYRAGEIEAAIFADEVIKRDWMGTLDAEQVSAQYLSTALAFEENTGQTDEAVDFLRFFVSPEHQRQMGGEGFFIPVAKGSDADIQARPPGRSRIGEQQI